MFLRLTNLENLRLTVEHTLTVRENNEWNWVLKNRLFVTTVYQTGTQSNKSADYRACSCLPNFFHLDRFGPRSVCEEHGMICQSVTAILAPKYFWKFNSSEQMNHCKNFVLNIQTFNAEYNRDFSSYRTLLPTPIKCPFTDSCNGGIESSCTEGYEGTLCATCSSNHFLRFNRCLECPSMLVRVTSCVLVIVVFIFSVFTYILGRLKRCKWRTWRYWGRCRNVLCWGGGWLLSSGLWYFLSGTASSVACSSCVYGKILEVCRGEQLAPLSHINPVFRVDPFMQFCLSISFNISVILLILMYLLLKRQYIRKLEILEYQKMDEVSHLKKSCYRNIFLFLLLSYPITSKKIIIVILPLPEVCDVCVSPKMAVTAFLFWKLIIPFPASAQQMVCIGN